MVPGVDRDLLAALCIVIAASSPLGTDLVPDTTEIVNYEVLLFVPKEIEADFPLRPAEDP